MSNPFRRPVGGAEQAHRPVGRRAPCRWIAVPAPDADFPMAALAGCEGGAGIVDAQGLLRRNLAAVPEIAVVSRELRGGGRH